MHYNIKLPDNKSVKIRLMVADFVRGRALPQLSGDDCNDVAVVRRALDALSTDYGAPVRIDVEDCGAALRFITALAAAIPRRTVITGTPRLMQRPLSPLINALNSAGASVKKIGNDIVVDGKILNVSELCVDASLSSQFVSALVLAAPLMNLHDIKLLSPDIPSLSYVKMTLSCVPDFDVTVQGVEKQMFADLGEPGDWSAAAFWFAHSCLHPDNSYSLHPLSLDSVQEDSVMADWFTELGGNVSSQGNAVDFCFKKQDAYYAKTFDMSQNLDLVPVLAALACALPADFTFLNVGNLRFKESDRLHELVAQLSPFAEISHNEDFIRVRGNRNNDFSKSLFYSRHDHRLAMAFLLLTEKNRIDDVECVAKSYPTLLSQLCE